MADYTSLWEAFSTGWGGGQFGEIGPGTADWQERSEAFYSQQIGPAFGPEGGDFGDTTKYLTPLDIQEVEQAEEQFRMSIGDPYGGTDKDPFAWETLSRYSPEEAQSMLEDELYGREGLLGGETGTDYGTSLEKSGEAYTSSSRQIGESLTYGGLTSDISLQSGTSGLALKSGSGTKQAESVLSEAYKKSKSLGGTYLESQVESLSELKSNLNQALTSYISTIDREKEQWYQNILSDVQRAEGLGAFTEAEAAEGLESLDLGGEGFVYEKGEPSEFRDKVCGIGELVNPDTGECEAYGDVDLLYGDYGYEGGEIAYEVGEDVSPIFDPSDPGFDPSEFFNFAEEPSNLNVDPDVVAATETGEVYLPGETITEIPGDPVMTTEEWEQFTGGGSWGGGGSGGFTPIGLDIGGSGGFTFPDIDFTLPIEEEEEASLSGEYIVPPEEPTPGWGDPIVTEEGVVPPDPYVPGTVNPPKPPTPGTGTAFNLPFNLLAGLGRTITPRRRRGRRR